MFSKGLSESYKQGLHSTMLQQMGTQRGVFCGRVNNLSKAIKAGNYDCVWGVSRSWAQQVAL